MNSIFAQHDDEFNQLATDWIKTALFQSQHKLVQLPAGNTPLGLYKYWEKTNPAFLKQCIFQQVDEIISGPKTGEFKRFFQTHLPSYFSQFINLNDNPMFPNIAILGVGENGHIAFHEPGIDFSFNYGCVKLSSETCAKLELNQNGQTSTWGMSYGTDHFKHCHSLLIIAKGESKRKILQESLFGDKVFTPISYILQTHIKCTLLTDFKMDDPSY